VIAHRLRFSSGARVRSLLLASAAALTLLLLACTGGDEPAAAAPGSVPEASDSCSEVAQAMAGMFPEGNLVEDIGRYSVGDVAGEGCRTLVFGDADEMPSFVEVAQTLAAFLVDAGWQEDAAFAADGPTGTVSGFTRGDELAVVAAGVAPSDHAACGADEIIGDCLARLAPSEVTVQGSIIVSAR
jgi:hypothetical protein